MKTEATIVALKHWPFCPFRGIPHIDLDYRCPSTIAATSDSFDISSRGDELVVEEVSEQEDAPKKRGRPRTRPIPVTKSQSMLFPVMEEGTYCWKCVHEGIREKEMGREVKKPRK